MEALAFDELDEPPVEMPRRPRPRGWRAALGFGPAQRAQGEAVNDGSREEGKTVVGSRPWRITAIVVAPGSGQRAFGVFKGLTLDAAQVATSIPLAVGQTFRFRLFLEAPPAMAERHGRVLWTEAVLNPAERLVAESRVQWVTATEAHEPSLGEAQEEGAA